MSCDSFLEGRKRPRLTEEKGKGSKHVGKAVWRGERDKLLPSLNHFNHVPLFTGSKDLFERMIKWINKRSDDKHSAMFCTNPNMLFTVVAHFGSRNHLEHPLQKLDDRTGGSKLGPWPLLVIRVTETAHWFMRLFSLPCSPTGIKKRCTGQVPCIPSHFFIQPEWKWCLQGISWASHPASNSSSKQTAHSRPLSSSVTAILGMVATNPLEAGKGPDLASPTKSRSPAPVNIDRLRVAGLKKAITRLLTRSCRAKNPRNRASRTGLLVCGCDRVVVGGNSVDMSSVDTANTFLRLTVTQYVPRMNGGRGWRDHIRQWKQWRRNRFRRV